MTQMKQYGHFRPMRGLTVVCISDWVVVLFKYSKIGNELYI